MLSREEIDNLAALARLELPEKEKEVIGRDLDSVLAYVSELQSAPHLEASLPSGQSASNVMREDEEPHMAGQYTDQILAQAPRKDEGSGFLKVKKILDTSDEG
jgi:aspartyl/glutamyl-tRNA(Asn/Gln) amidotransferase C subunit